MRVERLKATLFANPSAVLVWNARVLFVGFLLLFLLAQGEVWGLLVIYSFTAMAWCLGVSASCTAKAGLRSSIKYLLVSLVMAIWVNAAISVLFVIAGSTARLDVSRLFDAESNPYLIWLALLTLGLFSVTDLLSIRGQAQNLKPTEHGQHLNQEPASKMVFAARAIFWFVVGVAIFIGIFYVYRPYVAPLID